MGDGSSGPVLRAAGAVLGDLADLGYDAVWATVAAASVGAPHRRERVFIVAWAADAKGDRWDGRPGDQLSVGAGDLRRVGGQGTTAVGDGGGLHAAVSGDEPGVALLPKPGTMDDREKRTTHAGGNLTLQGAVVGVNPVDVERHSRAGRTVREPVDLLPTPTQSDGTGGGIRTGLSWEGTTKSTGDGGNSRLRDVAGLLGGPLLPTPRTSDTNGAGHHGDGGMDLRTTVTLLPTPNAADGNGGGRYSSEGHQSTLPGEARLLCTPSASDGAGGKTSRSGSRIDEPLLGGQAREMETSWGKYAAAIARWENVTGTPAPAPTEPNKNGNPRLSASFSEWIMGWPDGWVTDPAIGISRNDQLRIVGNGVCPQQAAAALRYLLAVTA
jgi:DNA (cytosine-5)-methyltransferase 1